MILYIVCVNSKYAYLKILAIHFSYITQSPSSHAILPALPWIHPLSIFENRVLLSFLMALTFFWNFSSHLEMIHQ